MKTIKELAEKTTFTKAEKDFLLSEAEKLNIEVNINPDCSNCYQDLALQIYKVQNENEPETTTSKYKLKKGIDVIFVGSGKRLNEATFTDEVAEWLIAHGLTKYLENYTVTE